MKTLYFPTPEAAELAFYSAIENADLDAMMNVWLANESSVCIHPLGPRLQGPVQIRASWRQILGSGIRLRFQISAVHRVVQGDVAIRYVQENITIVNAEKQATQPSITTNIYRQFPQGWRMILHHASPSPVPDSASSHVGRLH